MTQPGTRDTIGAKAGGYVPFSFVGDEATRRNMQVFGHAVASVEGGDYNKVVGGKSFDGYDRHPGITGMVTKDGPSTAAGRYQITGSTHRDIAGKIGAQDFSPESQDKMFAALLERNGALGDVAAGNFDAAMQKIGGTWQGVPSGKSVNQGKRTMEQWQAAVNEGSKLYSPVGAVTKPEVPEAGAGRGNINPTMEQIAPTLARPDDKIKDTTHLSIAGSGAATTSKTPVNIPKELPWGKPETVVQGKSGGGERMVVSYVQDGDGMYLKKKDGSQVECRIDSVDAPETAKPKYNKPGQPFGEEAKQTLKNLIDNKEVTVKITRAAVEGATGKERRNYCQIELEGQNIDKELLRKGAAWLYRRYNNDPELAGIEAEAKKNKTGLWADPAPENPEAFRRRIERK